MSILALFCSVDEFWQQFAPWWQWQLQASGTRQQMRSTRLYPSEIMPIAIHHCVRHAGARQTVAPAGGTRGWADQYWPNVPRRFAMCSYQRKIAMPSNR